MRLCAPEELRSGVCCDAAEKCNYHVLHAWTNAEKCAGNGPRNVSIVFLRLSVTAKSLGE